MGTRKMPDVEKNPTARWERTAELLRLVVTSSLIQNAPAPLSLLLVGPPGDGKSRMLERIVGQDGKNCGHVTSLSDTTYLGLVRFLELVRDKQKRALVIPDLATIAGRKSDVARQCMATMAMMAGEGVGVVSVGKTDRDFRGAQASVISAITEREFAQHHVVIDQNAFLSRTFVCDFNLELSELEALLHPRSGSRSPLDFGPTVRKGKMYPVTMSSRYESIARGWWKELREVRPDMWFAFRSYHAMGTLLKSSAYLSGRKAVIAQDVKVVSRVMPVLHNQIKMSANPPTGARMVGRLPWSLVSVDQHGKLWLDK